MVIDEIQNNLCTKSSYGYDKNTLNDQNMNNLFLFPKNSLYFVCGHFLYFFIVAEQAKLIHHPYGVFTQFTPMMNMTLKIEEIFKRNKCMRGETEYNLVKGAKQQQQQGPLSDIIRQHSSGLIPGVYN